MGSVSNHHNKVSIAIKVSHNLFALWGGSCLQLIKNATSVRHNKVKCNKRKYDCKMLACL